jgi:N-acetyl-anhydromuramyl-L-alanine amidase AmpD
MSVPMRWPWLALMCGAALVAGGAASAATGGTPRSKVHGIIIHSVSGPSCEGNRVVFSGAPGDAQRWKRFFDHHPFLGIHYIVDRNGTVAASTPEHRNANHALGHNDGTIGIELVNEGDGSEPFNDAQIEALIALIKSIRTRHVIALSDIRGHSDVDSRTFRCNGQTVKRKVDPGSNFPWERVRAALRREP